MAESRTKPNFSNKTRIIFLVPLLLRVFECKMVVTKTSKSCNKTFLETGTFSSSSQEQDLIKARQKLVVHQVNESTDFCETVWKVAISPGTINRLNVLS